MPCGCRRHGCWRGVAGQKSCTTLFAVLVFVSSVADLGLACLGLGVSHVVVGLAGRILGSEFKMLFGLPCSELLACMDSNMKRGDFQVFPLSIPYWWIGYGSQMVRVDGCGWTEHC